ncbi:hypothetical protein RUM43_007712 [Polyplax serrata]|uniref:Uncharacterized protein n=1 Tax=Polyplax serrata TaxID=468196 RepID=A0AAN8S8S8_POLSC
MRRWLACRIEFDFVLEKEFKFDRGKSSGKEEFLKTRKREWTKEGMLEKGGFLAPPCAEVPGGVASSSTLTLFSALTSQPPLLDLRN